MLVEDIENPYYNGVMLLLSLATEDEDVIHVNNHDSFISEDVVHHHLEHHWAVSEAEEHDERFEKVMVHPKSCLPLISFLNPYIVVSPSAVQLGEIFRLGFRHAVEDVQDQGQRVGVLYRHRIELLIILDKVEAPILPFDEEDQGCHW